MNYSSSHRDLSLCQRVQIVQNHLLVPSQSIWVERFLNLLEKIQQSSDKKKDNYSYKKLDLLGHLSFDLLTLDEQIIAFCGLYSGGRYPSGAYRILNRCYVAPEFRTNKWRSFSDLNSRFLLNLQLAEYQNEVCFPFVSREGLHGGKFLEHWSRNNAPGKNWIVSNDMIHVVPKSHESSAYQFICYQSSSDFINHFNKITVDEWISRYGAR